MVPDYQCAGAATTATADSGLDMHVAAVKDAAHDVDVPSVTKMSTRGIGTKKLEITRRDVHTASSINAQRRYPKASTQEPNLAHQAAFRRSSVKGQEFNQKPLSRSSSTPTSKPVLVRAPSRPEMKNKPKPRVDTESPQLPSLESFSIQDILASIGPEADASLDAIAEICGRSKMSLAEQHGSHRPPHVQLVKVGSSPAESLPSMRLETVAETTPTGPQTRSKSSRLALANVSITGDAMSSDATAATSNVTSFAHKDSLTQRTGEDSTNSASNPLISQIFTWLGWSGTGDDDSNASDQHLRAMRVLRNVLSDTDSVRS